MSPYARCRPSGPCRRARVTVSVIPPCAHQRLGAPSSETSSLTRSQSTRLMPVARTPPKAPFLEPGVTRTGVLRAGLLHRSLDARLTLVSRRSSRPLCRTGCRSCPAVADLVRCPWSHPVRTPASSGPTVARVRVSSPSGCCYTSRLQRRSDHGCHLIVCVRQLGHFPFSSRVYRSLIVLTLAEG